MVSLTWEDERGHRFIVLSSWLTLLTTGGHRAGTFEFDIESVLVGVEPADAPCRVKLVFGEALNDVAESFEDYKQVVFRPFEST